MRCYWLLLVLQMVFSLSTSAFAAPVVIGESPLAGSTGVSVPSALSATFSEAMNPSSITDRSFTLEKRVGVVAVSAGHYTTLALKGDGTVAAWGFNSWDTTVPAGLQGVIAIDAGYYHSLALKSDGTVVGWGSDAGGGSIVVPEGLAGVKAISAGPYHNLALKKDGTVVAWGRSDEGQTTVPAGLSGVKAIAAGHYHSLALKEDGTVVAWGWNGYGQATVPAGLSGLKAIAAGRDHSLALKADGTVVVWGEDGDIDMPPELNDVVAITAGNLYSVAVKGDGTVVAWGGSYHPGVPEGLSGVVAVSTQYGHSVALKGDGSIVTWGLQNEHWQQSPPDRLTGVIDIAGSPRASFLTALKADGTITTWGDHVGEPADLTGIASLHEGDVMFAIKSDGGVAPVGQSYPYWAPFNVPADLSGVVAMASAGCQTFAVKDDGTVVTWIGNNGQVACDRIDLPEGLSGIVDIAATLWSPPGSISPQLYVMALKGDGTVINLRENALIAGLNNVVDIKVGSGFLVALKSDGTVFTREEIHTGYIDRKSTRLNSSHRL